MTECRPVDELHFFIRVRQERMAGLVLPGQFAMLSAWGIEPLLPRPFSVFSVKEGQLGFLIQKRGMGTALLAALRPGQSLLITAPLGRPFPQFDRTVLVAGGVGTAPLRLYAAVWPDKVSAFYLGLRDYSEEFHHFHSSVSPLLAVENNPPPFAKRGTVVDRVAAERPKADAYLACGPEAMLKALTRVLPKTKLYLSLESPMVCGFGVCMACAVKRADGDGYYRACTDGSVFRADRVLL